MLTVSLGGSRLISAVSTDSTLDELAFCTGNCVGGIAPAPHKIPAYIHPAPELVLSVIRLRFSQSPGLRRTSRNCDGIGV